MKSEIQKEHNEWLLEIGDGKLPRNPSLNDPELIEIPERMFEEGCSVTYIFGDNPDKKKIF